MSQNASFTRKVIYIVTIALLLMPMSCISQPATKSAADSKGSAGGLLAKMRSRNHLSEANLGEIDPASETMKLATLGLRGVATSVLWHRSTEAKKRQDWDVHRATLNQITKLQPHFASVWEFQAHNLAYNISAEFDDYRYRYLWIKKGIDFLIEGTRQNHIDGTLLHFTGWIVGQKIGIADEHVQFRRLFREDDEFHDLMEQQLGDINESRTPDGQCDNWLMSRLWYLKCYHMVETQGASMRNKAPLVYFGDGPMCRLNFAMAYEKENDPGEGEVPKYLWSKALEEYREFGNRSIRTTFGTYVKLNEYEDAMKRAEELQEKFDDFVPKGIKDKLKQEIVAEFPKEVRAAFAKPKEERSVEERDRVSQWNRRIRFSNVDVANACPSKIRREALELAAEVDDAKKHLMRVEGYRSQVNYPFWESRCMAEASDECVRARKHIYDAHLLYLQQKYEAADKLNEAGNAIPILDKDGNPVIDEETGEELVEKVDGAKEVYAKAWKEWEIVFEKHPLMLAGTIAEELAPRIVEYRNVLLETGERELPADFPLTQVLDIRNRNDGLPTALILREFYEALNEPSEGESKDGDADDSNKDSSTSSSESSEAKNSTEKESTSEESKKTRRKN